MENRLYLNKRHIYKLPEDVLIELCNLDINRYNIPDFEPDLCLSYTGTIKVTPRYKTKKQYWIKSDDKNLIDFISSFDWNSVAVGIGIKSIPLNTLKKTILEEYYGE